MTIRRFRSQHMIWCVLPGFRPSGDLSSYVNYCHIHHAHIHNSFNHSLPLTVCMPLTFFLCRTSSHTCTYTFIYNPTHPHTPTATYSSMTKIQNEHFCTIAQCTMVKNVHCAWQFISKALSNTLCTLFVQTLIIQKLKRFTQLNYKCPCLLCPCRDVSREVTKCIRQAANSGTRQQ